jgi:cytidylate kinase
VFSLKSVIISGMPAAGKTTVGKIVASELGMKLIGGGDVLKEMAVERGYTSGGEDWWDTEQGMKFLQERKKSPDFDVEVDQRLVKKAGEGNYVITSYTLPWLSSEGIKVWLLASVKSRARRMAKRDGMGVRKCMRILSIRDRENYLLYKNLYGIEFGKDLSPFHLVVDTEYIDEKRVASLIVAYVKARSS